MIRWDTIAWAFGRRDSDREFLRDSIRDAVRLAEKKEYAEQCARLEGLLRSAMHRQLVGARLAAVQTLVLALDRSGCEPVIPVETAKLAVDVLQKCGLLAEAPATRSDELGAVLASLAQERDEPEEARAEEPMRDESRD